MDGVCVILEVLMQPTTSHFIHLNDAIVERALIVINNFGWDGLPPRCQMVLGQDARNYTLAIRKWLMEE